MTPGLLGLNELAMSIGPQFLVPSPCRSMGLSVTPQFARGFPMKDIPMGQGYHHG